MLFQTQFPHAKAVIIDLDDTLCGYWDAAKAGLDKAVTHHFTTQEERKLFHKHWVEAFRDFIQGLHDTDWYPKYLVNGGVTRLELMRRALERAGLEDPVLAQGLSNLYHSERQAELKLFPDAIPFLELLRPQYKLALLTNGPADVQRQEVEVLGISDYFGIIAIEGERGYGKPDERAYLSLLEAFNIEANQAVMIGNSYRHDIRPAIKLGLGTVWIKRDSDVAPTSLSGLVEARPADAPEPNLTVANLKDLF